MKRSLAIFCSFAALGVVTSGFALVGGCAALPPMVSAGAAALTGATLAFSGKTPSDHAISAATEQDCAMWRLFVGREMCQNIPVVRIALDLHVPPPDPGAKRLPANDRHDPPIAYEPPKLAELSALPDVAPAADAEMAKAAVAVAAIAPAAGPVTGSAAGSETEMAATPKAAVKRPLKLAKLPASKPKRPEHTTSKPAKPVAKKTAAAAPPENRYLLVLGSYRNITFARERKARFAALSPRIVQVRVKGQRIHRVVVGPYSKAELPKARRRLIARKVDDPWAILVQPPLNLARADTGKKP